VEHPQLRTVTIPALSQISGLVHGFGRRHADEFVEDKDATRARFRLALETEGRLLLLHQTHGTVLHHAPWEGRPEGDGSLASAEGFLLGIETADCLPILLVDPVRRVIAAVHAGWRGTAAGIAARAVEAMIDLGSRAADLVAALGPCIGACCYEVGPELRDSFGELAHEVLCRRGGEREHLDIQKANRLMLRARGVTQIHEVAECTACHPQHYYSYRRDGRGGGRMISFVGFRCPSLR
jgi:hypothetical protein